MISHLNSFCFNMQNYLYVMYVVEYKTLDSRKHQFLI